MAERITESAPTPQNTEINNDRSYLTILCEDGFQKVKVTNVYKKFVELMCTEENPTLQYLDQAMHHLLQATQLWSGLYGT